MPYRILVADKMAAFLSVLAHRHRLRIVEELRKRELDVGTLQGLLEISHSSASQHLALLRAHGIVEERREGRRVFYHLVAPALASWLTDGLAFIDPDDRSSTIRAAVRKARRTWSSES